MSRSLILERQLKHGLATCARPDDESPRALPSNARPEFSGTWFTGGAFCNAHRHLACLGNPDPVGLKVYVPTGEETVDDPTITKAARAGAFNIASASRTLRDDPVQEILPGQVCIAPCSCWADPAS